MPFSNSALGFHVRIFNLNACLCFHLADGKRVFSAAAPLTCRRFRNSKEADEMLSAPADGQSCWRRCNRQKSRSGVGGKLSLVCY